MAKNYHGRSPEELRQYLDSLNQRSKKKNWKHMVILIDIFLLLLVFYFIYLNLNPGSMNLGSKSQPQVWNDIRITLTSSQLPKSESILLYLLLDNPTNEDKFIENKDWKFSFQWKTSDGIVCDHAEFLMEEKSLKIEAKSQTIQEINIPKPKNPKGIEECDSVYLSTKSKFGFGFMEKKGLHLDFHLDSKESSEKDRKTLSIFINPFR